MTHSSALSEEDRTRFEKLVHDLAQCLIINEQLRSKRPVRDRRSLWLRYHKLLTKTIEQLNVQDERLQWETLEGIVATAKEGSFAPFLEADTKIPEAGPRAIMLHYATMTLAEEVFRQLTATRNQQTMPGYSLESDEAPITPSEPPPKALVSVAYDTPAELPRPKDAEPVRPVRKHRRSGPATIMVDVLSSDLSPAQKLKKAMPALVILLVGILAASGAGYLISRCVPSFY